MVEDSWGNPVSIGFTWACRDESYTARDSCLSIRIGGEFAPDKPEVRFYEDSLPDLRALVAQLARQMTLQEEGAAGHDRLDTTNADWLRDELARLVEALPVANSEQKEPQSDS